MATIALLRGSSSVVSTMLRNLRVRICSVHVWVEGNATRVVSLVANCWINYVGTICYI